MKTLADILFPAQCGTCDTFIDADFGLCPRCWAQAEFITDCPCDACGRPLLGEAEEGDLCDDCSEVPRIWDKGRAALVYGDKGREVVLGIKHGDRSDLVPPAGGWLATAARDLVEPDTVVIPVPLHWTRMLKRHFNQSALLSEEVAGHLNLTHLPDGLKRVRATRCLDGMNATARRMELRNTIVPSRKERDAIRGKPVLLIDDVMTTGATLEACAKTCLGAGATSVNVAVLARVASR